jgi:hypothetical protein
MGGYVIHDGPTPGLDGLGPENSFPAQTQKLELQRQQIENQRLQNELLRRQLEQEQNARQAPPREPLQRQTAPRETSKGQAQPSSEFRSWQAANPWFGTDKPKTEFAKIYAKQLRQEQPGLVGKPFFDAVSAKVNNVFGTSKDELPKLE